MSEQEQTSINRQIGAVFMIIGSDFISEKVKNPY